MPGRLTAEDVVTIQVLSGKAVASRAIARQLGVTEGAVRYHLRPQASGAKDGRGPKVFAAAALVWSERADQVSWIACHNRAFERLGGIPAVNRIDNVKTAISRGAGAWGTLHPTFAAFARTLHFHVDACAPREPQQKGKTEAKVKLARRLIDPRRERFSSLAELQAVTDERVARFSERTLCPATGKTIAESFADERARLRPLPDVLPEPFDVAVLREVAPDCTVAFEGRRYAVPFALAGRQVEVRGCAG